MKIATVIRNTVMLAAFIGLLAPIAAQAEENNVKITFKVGEGAMLNGKDPVMANKKFENMATAKVVDGVFTFEAYVEEPTPVVIVAGQYYGFILEPGEYQATVSADGLQMEGGPYYELVYGYRSSPEYLETVRESRRIMSGVGRGDEDAGKRNFAAMGLIWEISNAHMESLIHGNHPVWVKYVALTELRGKYDRLALATELAKESPDYEPLQSYWAGLVELKQKNASKSKFAAGARYADIAAATVDGDMVKLSDVLAENKLVLLEFWASWCGPCRAQFPHLREVYAEYHDQGFEIYAISLDDNRDMWLDALEEEDVPWLNFVDHEAHDSVPALTYGVQGIPDGLLINSEGVILGRGLMGAKLDDALKDYYGDKENS